MKTQRFGIEIEMTGITRATAAKTIAKYFDTIPKMLIIRIFCRIIGFNHPRCLHSGAQECQIIVIRFF